MSGSRERYIGVAEEATYGTKIATDALFTYLDGESVSLDAPSDQAILFQGISRISPSHACPGAYIPEGDLVMPLDANVLGFFIKWALGNYAKIEQTSAGYDVYKHTFKPDHTLDSFTARIGRDVMEHVFEGLKISQMVIEIPKSGRAMVTVSTIGQQDSKETVDTATDLTLRNESYFCFHQAALSIGGAVNCENLTITINNNMAGDDGIRLGSRYPQFLERGALDVTIEADITFDSTTQYENFWGDASGPSDIDSYAVTVTLTGNTIADAQSYSVTLTLPEMIINSAPAPINMRERAVQSVSMTALYNEAAGYTIMAELVNTMENYSLTPSFKSISAYDANTVFTVGTNGKIYKTTNGGTTWTAATSGVSGFYDSKFNAVAAVSATVAFVAGDNGMIYKTTDGSTWVQLTSGITSDLNAVYAYDASTVWVAGNDGVILTTADGTAWTAQTSGITADLHGIAGIDNTEIVAVGNGGAILYTSDAGTTWTAKTSGVTTDLLAVSGFTNTTDQWLAVGETGTALSSTDGSTWSSLTSGVTTDLRGVSLASLTVGIAVGDDGTILTTSNGGSAWTAVDGSYDDYVIYGIDMQSATVAWLVGTLGLVAKTVNAGAAWTTQTI